MSIEAMILSCAIDENESRYVVVSDIPGASYTWTWKTTYTCY